MTWSNLKPEKTKRSKGRARPDDELATWCEAGITGVCTGRAEHRHHKLRRSQGGTDDADNTADLCAACHSWAHGHPAASYELDLLRRRSVA